MKGADGAAGPRLTVLPDPESLARHAAGRLAHEIRSALAARGECALALPGGGTPQEALELLAQEPGLGWARVVVVVGDERLVEPGDPRSHERMVRQALVGHLQGDQPQVLGWEVVPGLGPEMVSQRFEGRFLGVVPYVEGRPQLDVLVLGLGQDGHSGALFPERRYRDEAVVVTSKDDDGLPRVGLGPLALRSARGTFFLIEGESKAEALAQVLDGPDDPLRWPAQLVARATYCEIWCDRKAASRLRGAAF
ncbi:MAG: 6-phosphogluconolactonase [Candidatus Dormibacteria bacterium]